MAEHIHNSMVEAEFQSYVWWYIRRSYGPMKENGSISKRGYMMAHFSKFVRHGYLRVDATKSPETNVLVSAYKSADSVVIVAINKNTSAVNQQFSISNANGAIAKVTGRRTAGTENLVAVADINLTNGSFTANLPAQSVTTFVGALGTVNPPPPPPPAAVVTCNVSNLQASYVAGSSVPRPNTGCGEGIAAGAASFRVSGSDSAVTGWASVGGTHKFYNPGVRTITLNSLECGGTNVTPSAPVSCGTIEIIPDQTTSIANGVINHIRQPFSVDVRGKTLFISSNAPAVVEIYNIKGGKVASLNVSSATQAVKLSLHSGVYFAKARGMRDVMFVVR